MDSYLGFTQKVFGVFLAQGSMTKVIKFYPNFPIKVCKNSRFFIFKG